MTNPQLELLGGAILGQVFRRSAEAAKERLAEREQRHEYLMAERGQAIKDRISARKMSGGTWVRRFITVSIIGLITWLLYAFAFTGDTIYIGEVVERSGGILKGIFGGADSKLKFHELSGLVIHPETWSAVRALIGFYFGQAVK